MEEHFKGLLTQLVRVLEDLNMKMERIEELEKNNLRFYESVSQMLSDTILSVTDMNTSAMQKVLDTNFFTLRTVSTLEVQGITVFDYWYRTFVHEMTVPFTVRTSDSVWKWIEYRSHVLNSQVSNYDEDAKQYVLFIDDLANEFNLPKLVRIILRVFLLVFLAFKHIRPFAADTSLLRAIKTEIYDSVYNTLEDE